MRYDLLIRRGRVIDPRHGRDVRADVGIHGNVIAAVGSDLPTSGADQVLDVDGQWVVPGLIDPHVHVSSEFNGQFAHAMLVKAGVTTALDMAGPVKDVLAIAAKHGTGLNLAILDRIKPGERVADASPTDATIQHVVEESLNNGAFGVKVLGGHYPLTPDATRRIFEAANKAGCWAAFHCGTTETGSNLHGLREAVEILKGLHVHIAHINSYCRGAVKRAEEEALEAIDLLSANPEFMSESYLAVINGTWGKIINGQPESGTCRNSLQQQDYSDDEAGLRQAILDGYARVHARSGDQTVLLTGLDGVAEWEQRGTNTGMSFPVNPPAPRSMLATAKDAAGRFVVDAIATDGGGIPRNDQISSGMRLVQLNMLTPAEFVLKTSWQPATLLGLGDKGHLGDGADADITILDPVRAEARTTVIGGEVVMHEGIVFGRGATILSDRRGVEAVKKHGLVSQVVSLQDSGFYGGREVRAWVAS